MKHILYYLGALGSGGIESATVSLCNHFDDVVIDFLVDTEDSVQNQYYVNTIKNSRGKIYCLSYFYGGSRQNIWSRFAAFFRIGRSGIFSGLHFHVSYPSTLLYGLFAKAGGMKKLYATSHAKGTSIQNALFMLIQRLSRVAFPPFYTTLFAVSEGAGKWCYGKNSFIVIPNSIDANKFRYSVEERQKVRKELGANDSLIFGHIGRFAKDKNHSFMIDLFAMLNKRYTNSILLLIGEGPLLPAIKNKCESLGILQSVRFLPFTSNPEKYLWAMDYFLFPSLSEGFGLVAVEAQAASLPVVASINIPKDTKVTDIISYHPLDLKEWYDYILKLKETPQKRDIINSAKLKSFDVSEICKQLENYYLHENRS